MTNTVILGRTYSGKPMMGSLAFRLWKYEQDGDRPAAERLLKARNSIRKVWGQPPYDLTDDMTDLPMEGGFSFGRHRHA